MSVLKRHNEEEDTSEDGHYYISISDLMTSLLFIFILILTYVMLSFVQKENELSAQIKKIEQNIEYRADLLEQLKEELFEQDINVEIDKDKGNIRLKADLLFKRGSALISNQGNEQIGAIAKLLIVKMQEQKYINSIDTIFIEGHTDSDPIRVSNKCRAEWSNKELSAQRAINTYTKMSTTTNGEIDNLKNKVGKHLLSYSGYASTRQLCDEEETLKLNDKKQLRECKSKNRRIEFYFTVNTPNLKKMKEHLE